MGDVGFPAVVVVSVAHAAAGPAASPAAPSHQTTLRVSCAHVLFNLGLQLLDLVGDS